MGGVRNGKSGLEPVESGARQETLAVDPPPAAPEDPLHGKVEQHLQVASGLLRERQAPKAFGELVRASRSLPMTRRLAAALVTVSLRAGTEAAAITILSASLAKVEGAVRRADGSWLLDGALPAHEVREVLAIAELPGEEEGEFETLGGFVMAQLGHIPAAGEAAATGGWRFEVVDMDGHRVDKVLAAPETAAVPADD